MTLSHVVIHVSNVHGSMHSKDNIDVCILLAINLDASIERENTSDVHGSMQL